MQFLHIFIYLIYSEKKTQKLQLKYYVKKFSSLFLFLSYLPSFSFTYKHLRLQIIVVYTIHLFSLFYFWKRKYIVLCSYKLYICIKIHDIIIIIFQTTYTVIICKQNFLEKLTNDTKY